MKTLNGDALHDSSAFDAAMHHLAQSSHFSYGPCWANGWLIVTDGYAALARVAPREHYTLAPVLISNRVLASPERVATTHIRILRRWCKEVRMHRKMRKRVGIIAGVPVDVALFEKLLEPWPLCAVRYGEHLGALFVFNERLRLLLATLQDSVTNVRVFEDNYYSSQPCAGSVRPSCDVLHTLGVGCGGSDD